MKFELLFGLDQAAWSALLVDRSGVIRRANQFAVTIFGAVVQGEDPHFNAIWHSESGGTAEEFLSRLDRAPAPMVSLKLRVKGGNVVNFRGYVAAFLRDQQRFFLLQLFRENESGVLALRPPPMPDAQPQSLASAQTPQTAATDAATVDVNLAHKQKLDCALQLSRTVALDFNNALTSILGHTSMVLSKMAPDHPWYNALVEVEKSAEKAAETAQDLAAFSRQEKESKELASGNVNDLVRRTVELFQRNVDGSKITWSIHLEPKPYSAKIDEAKLQQALVKIFDNSVQALPSEGGQITVASRNYSIEAPLQVGTAHLAPGNYISLEIADTGIGISPEILPRVFEPFFTTKPANRGLGLAWVYGIVTNHGGSVALFSEPGQGTIIKIFIPAQKRLVKSSAAKNEELYGHETILMVDDEDLLLTMGEMILPAFGYRILTANSGEKAIEVFNSNLGQIDLVITDLVMPGMGGRELIQRLRQISPELRVLCTSGVVRGGNMEEESYLQKPFTSQGLLRKVKELLS